MSPRFLGIERHCTTAGQEDALELQALLRSAIDSGRVIALTHHTGRREKRRPLRRLGLLNRSPANSITHSRWQFPETDSICEQPLDRRFRWKH